MSDLYDKESIESLEPLEFTRLKPGVYAGDTTYSTQLLIEIVSNAIDEFRLGHGTDIYVAIDSKNNEYSVRDDGQGFIPNSFRDDGKSILEAAFSVLNTSGKYREDGTYEGTSLGSFGIGAKIVTFLSHWLTVSTFRDGEAEHLTFVEGKLVKRKFGKTSEHDGTLVMWKPNEEFFTHPEVNLDKVKDLFKTLTCLCQGLTITLTIDEQPIVFSSKRGLDDLVDEAVDNNELINNRFHMNYVDGKNRMDMILTYTSKYSFTLVPYVNTGLTESGPHITQLKTTITREFNKFFREKKWLKEKDDNLTGDDLQEGMYIVFNITAPNVSYDAQVKTRITKIDTKPFMQAVADNLQIWFHSNEKELKVIADKAINAKKARDAARKAKDVIREGQKKKKEKVLKFDSKLADCYSKDRSKCEIYVVEGEQ